MERGNPKLNLHNRYFPDLPNLPKVDGMESDLVPQRERKKWVKLTSLLLMSDYRRPYRLPVHLVVGALNGYQRLNSEEQFQ